MKNNTWEKPAEYQMIETIRCVDVHITGIKETPTQHDKHISLVGKFGEDAAECVSFAAIPFIYFVSALSFLGAKPAGASVKEYQEHDAWTIGDTVLGILRAGKWIDDVTERNRHGYWERLA